MLFITGESRYIVYGDVFLSQLFYQNLNGQSVNVSIISSFSAVVGSAHFPVVKGTECYKQGLLDF